MGVVILPAGPRIAEGVASRTRQAEHDLDLNGMNPCQPEVIENTIDAQPLVFARDDADSEHAELV